MFPLTERKIGGFVFRQLYPKSFGSLAGHPHLGVDYSARENTTLYAPFNGTVLRNVYGSQGGNTIWFKPDHDDVIIRFMHLNSYAVIEGSHVNEGRVIGRTGNTGSATTAAHLHLDISKHDVDINNIDNFIDPEQYNWDWGKELFMTYELFGEKSTGRVFERHVDYSLTHIPSPEFANQYYGEKWGDKVQWVDDIHSVGWIATEIKDQLDALRTEFDEFKKNVQPVTSDNEQAIADYLKANPPKVEVRTEQVINTVEKIVDRPLTEQEKDDIAKSYIVENVFKDDPVIHNRTVEIIKNAITFIVKIFRKEE